MLVYLLGTGEEYGFILLDKPSLPDLIPVVLEPWLDLTESFLSNAEAAMDHKEAGTLPDYIDNPEECRRCPHFNVNCSPTVEYSGAHVELDPTAEADMEKLTELRPWVREFNYLDKKLKAQYRGVEQVICGNYLATGEWSSFTHYFLPDEVKKKIEDLRKPHKVVDPKGRFSLKISKL